MADISKISLPNGTTYNIKDSNALTDEIFTPPVIVITTDAEEREIFPENAMPLLQKHKPFCLRLNIDDKFIETVFFYCGLNNLKYDNPSVEYFSIGMSIMSIDLVTREVHCEGEIKVNWVT